MAIGRAEPLVGRGIDYHRLVDGLGEVMTLLDSASESAAVEALVTTLRESTGAAGATFTEYGGQGGRVVVAQEAMSWALGQPVLPTMTVPGEIDQPYLGWVESMPPEAAQPLLARGLVAAVGHPVRAGNRTLGSLHVFFTEFSPLDGPAVREVLRVAAAFADRFYTGQEATPIRSPDEEDDRSLFLAVAGHELRTPVTVIKGYASLLADRWESLGDEQRRSAAKVLTQRADELARLVDRLLGASVDDAATSGLVRVVPFDPLDALVRAAGAMSTELRRTVTVALPNWLPPAAGDPDVIGTVVTELVTNAVRASDNTLHNGPSRVDLTAGADADTVYIQVRDRGVGIDPTEAERAFERFWRGPRPPSANTAAERDQDGRGGVGLGLYLVRRLVERQNGWVSLRPRDGGGTIAEVRLARADGPPSGRTVPRVGENRSATGGA